MAFSIERFAEQTEFRRLSRNTIVQPLESKIEKTTKQTIDYIDDRSDIIDDDNKEIYKSILDLSKPKVKPVGIPDPLSLISFRKVKQKQKN